MCEFHFRDGEIVEKSLGICNHSHCAGKGMGMAKRLQGLEWRLYGSEQPGDVLPVVSIDTDRGHHPYWLVKGVPIDPFSVFFRLVVVKGHRKAMHAEIQLMTRQRVVCWDRDFIDVLWSLGIPLSVYAHPPVFLNQRLELKERGNPMGYPPLYEVDRSGVAASA